MNGRGKTKRSIDPAMTLLLMFAGCTPPPTPPPPEETAQQRCERLREKTLEGASITEATLVAASSALPEYCKVTGLLPAERIGRREAVWRGRAGAEGPRRAALLRSRPGMQWV